MSIIRRSARHMLMVDREDSHGINIKLQLIEMISTEIIEELESQKRPLTKEESRQATLEAIAQLEETRKKMEEEIKCLKS